MSSVGNGLPKLNDCGCCEAAPALTPPQNAPGLSALSYRLGTHGGFLLNMLSRIHSQTIPDGTNKGTRPLAALTTRSTDDAAVALLDAWATVCDVLAFYQERIANEGYLRTATERRSVLELARAIGYELSPGVAASTFLAFTIEDAPGAPSEAPVPRGIKVKSVPPPGKLPQTFETIEDIVGRAECNVIKPRLFRPQPISVDMSTILFTGTATNLKPGDGLLIVVENGNKEFRRIKQVQADGALQRTRVDLEGPVSTPPPDSSNPSVGAFSFDSIPLNNDNVDNVIAKHVWRKGDLDAFAFMQGWNTGEVFSNMAAYHAPVPPTETGIFAFRVRASLFGYNAPDWKTISTDAKTAYGGQGGDKLKEWPVPAPPPNQLDLDTLYNQILPGTVAVVAQSSKLTPITIFNIESVSEAAAANFTMGAKVTRLNLDQPVDVAPMGTLRETVVYAQTEKLEPADLAIDDPIKGHTIDLDRLYQGLDAGQLIVVSGERSDAAGVHATDVAMVSDVIYAARFTTITLVADLTYQYRRNTVTINANVAHATHGETVREVLGSGDASQINQRFALKKPPLTYVSAPTPSGALSTLAVRVNDVLWREEPSLYGLGEHDESYTVRLDDDGKTSLIFGDGEIGARLPSGQENVTAVYRSGIGVDGEVDRGSLTLLQTRPLGVRSVTNPVAASGAAAPEDLDHARVNAPLKVLTLDRIVSLEDYEDFARAFAGIGKAQAVPLWNGDTQLVHITVAAATGGAVDSSSSLYQSLVQAIDSVHDPVQQVQVASYQPVLFNLAASVLVDSRYVAANVLAAVEAALKVTFSFENRAFSQAATAAQAVTVIQSVSGVIATDLTKLYIVTDPNGPGQTEPLPFLPAAAAQWQGNNIQPAQLLQINPAGVTLVEMKP